MLSQKQEQIPVKKQQQTQQMEQIYYVFQDLSNVTGVLAETIATLNYFENQPDHPYVAVALNRLILQLNLSNAIQYDQKETYLNDNKLTKQYNNFKQQASKMFQQFIEKQECPEQIQHLAQHYLNNNVNQNNILKQLIQQQTKQKAEFNSESITKIFENMNAIDYKIDNIKKGEEVKIPTAEEIIAQAKERQQRAYQKLSENFEKLETIKNQENEKKQKQNDKIKEPTNSDEDISVAEDQDSELKIQSIIAKTKKQIKKNKQKKP